MNLTSKIYCQRCTGVGRPHKDYLCQAEPVIISGNPGLGNPHQRFLREVVTACKMIALLRARGEDARTEISSINRPAAGLISYSTRLAGNGGIAPALVPASAAQPSSLLAVILICQNVGSRCINNHM